MIWVMLQACAEVLGGGLAVSLAVGLAVDWFVGVRTDDDDD